MMNIMQLNIVADCKLWLFNVDLRIHIKRLVFVVDLCVLCTKMGNVFALLHAGAQDSRLASQLTSLQAKISSSRMILFSW